MVRKSTRQNSDRGENAEAHKFRKPAGHTSGSASSTKPASSASHKSTALAHSLYDLLGVAQDASPREITAAYRRRALICHPDKIRQRQNNENESSKGDRDDALISLEEATKHFQQLQAAYDILHDPKKRERYDRTGETGDAGLEGKSYEEAYAFYREKFPEVTEEAIDQFKVRYIGSEEEKEDIQDFVSKFKGDLTTFFEFIPLSDPSDAKRYMEVLSRLVKEKRINETATYTKTFHDFESIAAKYKKRFDKEKKTGNKRKPGKTDDDASSLTLAILGNMSKREAASNRFLEELGQKYSKKGRKA